MRPLRIAVVGAGPMGRRHAEKVAALAAAGGDVTLSGVADPAAERAREVASALGTSHDAIRARWSRCLKTLRKALAQDPGLALLRDWVSD